MKKKDKLKCIKVLERVLYTLQYFNEEEPKGHVYDKTARGYPFICNMIEFTEIDIDLVLNYLRNQQPTSEKYLTFFNNISFWKNKSLHYYIPKSLSLSGCWWATTTAGVKQRIKFLTFLIKKLKK